MVHLHTSQPAPPIQFDLSQVQQTSFSWLEFLVIWYVYAKQAALPTALSSIEGVDPEQL